MVLQGKIVIYDIDVFIFIICKIEELIGKKYGGSFILDVKLDMVMWVVADYLWVVAFIIVDGQLLSNIGVGYVIWCIFCWVVWYYYFFFDVNVLMIYQLLLVMVAEMGNFFFEFKVQQGQIVKIIEVEEKIFLNIFEKGISCFESIEFKDGVIQGEDVFSFYDIYGFFIDFICLMVEE